ncbi:hypothetical protein FRC05_005952 [Tulasnella sp. 425]|nr:hypothetical protein FRC05_005952 [Tulasnella sp. 425]
MVYQIADFTIVGHRILALQKDVEGWQQRAETATAKNKEHETQIIALEQEITSLRHQVGAADEQAEKARKEAKDAVQKWVWFCTLRVSRRLQVTEAENEGLQRTLTSVTEDRDAWQEKFEEMSRKYSKAMRDFDDFVQSASNM